MSIDRSMAVDSTPRIVLARGDLRATSRSVPSVRTARLALGLIVAVSAAVRSVGVLAHPVPSLFPDEYIYTALARALGSTGHPSIRGGPAHFPALLEPLAAAPLWALAPTRLAYHLVQVENAIFLSLAAIPVYLLARRLRLGTRYSLACALFAVAIPDLAYAARTLADPLAYPLALGALYAAVVALERPTRRSQLVFFALACLASLARVQYVVLVAAYFGALVVTRRRDALRTHRLSIGLLGVGGAAAVALGPARTLGYYSVVVDLHAGIGTLHWMSTDLFLIAVASGIALVPGGLIGLATAKGRGETSFAAMTAFYTGGLLFAAGLYASNGAGRFQERYLFSLLPLIPIAFGLYLRNGRPARLLAVALGAVLLIVGARVPLSGFAISTGSTDSPLLWAVVRLNSLVDTGTSSLLVAAFIASAAGLAALVAFGLRARVAFAACITFLVAASLGATAADIHSARLSASEFVAQRPTWVDDAHVGDVTAVATRPAPTGLLTEQLYWNRTVTHEALLAGASPTDAFATIPVRIARDGTLMSRAGAIRTPILFEQYGVSASFRNARLIAATPSFALWKPKTVVRFRMLETGKYQDGWLDSRGYLALWPPQGERLKGVLRFTVSLPDGFKPTRLSFGRKEATIRPGTTRRFSYCVDSAQPWRIYFEAGRSFLPDLRTVSVRQTTPRFVGGASCGSPTPTP
jgi:Dolichyl-phosphate-mannose-protein mannosyltransferase